MLARSTVASVPTTSTILTSSRSETRFCSSSMRSATLAFLKRLTRAGARAKREAGYKALGYEVDPCWRPVLAGRPATKSFKGHNGVGSDRNRIHLLAAGRSHAAVKEWRPQPDCAAAASGECSSHNV